MNVLAASLASTEQPGTRASDGKALLVTPKGTGDLFGVRSHKVADFEVSDSSGLFFRLQICKSANLNSLGATSLGFIPLTREGTATASVGGEQVTHVSSVSLYGSRQGEDINTGVW